MRIRRGTITSVPALERAIVWAKDADTILAKIHRCKNILISLDLNKLALQVTVVRSTDSLP